MSTAIVAEQLGKRFGDTVALDGVDLAVPQGTVLGVLGPNGAGKTTTVRILTTQLRPDTGQARVLGLDVLADPESVRRRIGLAGQYAAVDERLTGRENLVMISRLNHRTKAVSRDRAVELLDRFQLTDAADRAVKTYSGGMRRRLDLAASLVTAPPVLFLDEPTTGLDPRSRVELWGVIEELVADGTTLLLTTQYLEEADRLADHIAVVDHGRIIAEGTATELKRLTGLEVITVDLADVSAALTARDVVDALALDAELGIDGDRLEVRVRDAAASLGPVAAALERAAITPRAVDVRKPTLDDAFLTLTGQAPGTAQPDPHAPAAARTA
ncbi:ATP-binding cassette domain-containing protein [Nitriliruptoraceae bacterium ZYF776]|nr:ATP-binding cassette domain-containing protein [Profundirhabdus halotolerans]